MREPTCINCWKKGHLTKDCKSPVVDKSKRPCSKCGQTGHPSFKCKATPKPGAAKMVADEGGHAMLAMDAPERDIPDAPGGFTRARSKKKQFCIMRPPGVDHCTGTCGDHECSEAMSSGSADAIATQPSSSNRFSAMMEGCNEDDYMIDRVWRDDGCRYKVKRLNGKGPTKKFQKRVDSGGTVPPWQELTDAIKGHEEIMGKTVRQHDGHFTIQSQSQRSGSMRGIELGVSAGRMVNGTGHGKGDAACEEVMQPRRVISRNGVVATQRSSSSSNNIARSSLLDGGWVGNGAIETGTTTPSHAQPAKPGTLWATKATQANDEVEGHVEDDLQSEDSMDPGDEAAVATYLTTRRAPESLKRHVR